MRVPLGEGIVLRTAAPGRGPRRCTATQSRPKHGRLTPTSLKASCCAPARAAGRLSTADRADPTPSEIRTWARNNNMHIPERGPIPTAVRQEWERSTAIQDPDINPPEVLG